jgi:hypothetical protein
MTSSPNPVGNCTNWLLVKGQKICSPLANIGTIGDLITRVLTFLIPLASVVLFIVLLWGGFDFLTSQGDAEKLKKGRAKIVSGLIGFAIIVLAYTATKVIAYLFGLSENSAI